MPSFGNTPEKLLGRNDSKNPASTCKGITSNGRPCRRALAASSASRRNSDALNGVVALVKEDGQLQEADFYCWQHKDQAEQRVEDENQNAKRRRTKKRSTELFTLQEKSSIDTMVQRLGLDAEDVKKAKKTKNPRPPRKTQTNDFAKPSEAPHAQKYGLGTTANRPKSKPKPQGFWASLCCMTAVEDDDYVEIVRHKKRVSQAQQQQPVMTATTASVPGRKLVASSPSQPSPQHRTSSNTQANNLLSLIPQTLSPQTTSTLLAELVKPISPADEEGYIYIFWLTPQSNSQPSETTARSILTPPSARPQHERRISDVITEFSFDGSEESTRGGPGGRNGSMAGKGKKTVMLKIGRANNITRRMNEWSRQCGYALNLVRWYPYVPSSGTPVPSPAASPSARRQSQQPLYPDLSRPASNTNSPSASRRQSDVVRKVPYVKRVERLIHLELADQRVMKQCAACGKEHREWFEVEASTAGVKAVDETVRRWVGWAEREAGTGS